MITNNAFSALPLATHPLSTRDRARVMGGIEQLRELVGPPGEYGYVSRLGIVLCKLYDIHSELGKQSCSESADASDTTEGA